MSDGVPLPSNSVAANVTISVSSDRVSWDPTGFPGPTFLVTGGSLVPVTVRLPPPLLLCEALYPPPSRPRISLLSSAERSTPVPESGLTPPATYLHPPSDRNVCTSPHRRRRRKSRDSEERSATVGARDDIANTLWALTQSGGSPTADTRRRRRPLSWRMWQNGTRQRASLYRRLPAAIGPHIALPGYPPSPLRAPCLTPTYLLGSPPDASAHCIYHIIPTPTNQLFYLAHVAPLSCLSLLICVKVRVVVRPTAAAAPLAAA